MKPTTDWLTTSHPLQRLDHVAELLSPILSRAGGCPDVDARVWRFFGQHRDTGVVRIGRQHAVGTVSTSGVALACLRAANLWLDFLHTLGQVEHRVTRLDIALDRPEPASQVIRVLRRKARSGGVALSRKSIAPRDVQHVDRLDPEGRVAGTLYLGSADRHDASARVYCKRSERIDRGHADPGPLTRYEVTARSGLRPTLRDAADPSPLFWHLAAPGLLARPEGIRDWHPQAEGFVLPPRTQTLAADRLRGLVERGYADPLLRLASDLGPHGLDYLHGILGRRAAVLAQPSEASASVSMKPSPAVPVTSTAVDPLAAAGAACTPR